MEIEFAKDGYTAGALQKAAYSVADYLSVSISERGTNYVAIISNNSNTATKIDTAEFVQRANDYSLRERISTKTEPLRMLMLAHAYSRTQFVQK